MEAISEDIFYPNNQILTNETITSDYDSSAYNTSTNLSTSSLSNCSSISSPSSSITKSPTLEKMKIMTVDGYTKLDNDETTVLNDFFHTSQQQEQQNLTLQDNEPQQMLQQTQQQINQQVLQQLGFNLYDDNLDLNYATINTTTTTSTTESITENTINNFSTLYGTPAPSLIDSNNYNNNDDNFSHKILNISNDSNLYIDDDFILNYLNPQTELNQQLSSTVNNLYTLIPSTDVNSQKPLSSSFTRSPSSLLTTTSTPSPIASPASDLNYLELRGSSSSSSSNTPCSIIGIRNESSINLFNDFLSGDNGICFKFEYAFENQKLVQVQPPPPPPPNNQSITLADATNSVVMSMTEPISILTSSYDSTDGGGGVDLSSPIKPASYVISPSQPTSKHNMVNISNER